MPQRRLPIRFTRALRDRTIRRNYIPKANAKKPSAARHAKSPHRKILLLREHLDNHRLIERDFVFRAKFRPRPLEEAQARAVHKLSLSVASIRKIKPSASIDDTSLGSPARSQDCVRQRYIHPRHKPRPLMSSPSLLHPIAKILRKLQLRRRIFRDPLPGPPLDKPAPLQIDNCATTSPQSNGQSRDCRSSVSAPSFAIPLFFIRLMSQVRNHRSISRRRSDAVHSLDRFRPALFRRDQIAPHRSADRSQRATTAHDADSASLPLSGAKLRLLVIARSKRLGDAKVRIRIVRLELRCLGVVLRRQSKILLLER